MGKRQTYITKRATSKSQYEETMHRELDQDQLLLKLPPTETGPALGVPLLRLNSQEL